MNDEAWISEGGFLVANVYNGCRIGNKEMMREIVDENAYLMASAPELLQELTRLRDALNPWLNSGRKIPGITSLEGANAAIDAAKGITK